MTTRLLDTTGAAWPDTGRRCTVCGWPTSLDDTHLLCELAPGPAPVESNDPGAVTFDRLCTDCGLPLPATAGIGITCHLACWQNRKATRP